jgi:hypothetical protein
MGVSWSIQHLGDNDYLRAPRRRELLTWMKREAPSLAPAYEGALHILHSDDFPGKVHFVSHAVRDIYNKLPEVLDGATKRKNSGEVYPSLVANLANCWDQEAMLTAESTSKRVAPAAGGEAIRVSRRLLMCLRALLERHREMKAQPSTAQHLGRVLYSLNPTHDFRISERLVKRLDYERKWFTNRAHLASSSVKLDDEAGLTDHFERFERTLFSFVSHFFSGTHELDEILREANKQSVKPTEELVAAAVDLVSDPHQARYFFDRLDNPLWIQPLASQGFFSEPPLPVCKQGVDVTHPHWPESKYLARMAGAAPDDVALIFVGMDLQNASVVRDMADTIAKVPARIAATLAPRICEACDAGNLWLALPLVGEQCAGLPVRASQMRR